MPISVAHLVQFDPTWESPKDSFQKVHRLLSGAKVNAGDLVLLPEMFDTGFSMNTAKTADRGDTLLFLMRLADETGAIVQGGRTVASSASNKASNIMTVAAPGRGVIAEYAKVHPFSLGREHEHFRGGKRSILYDWQGLKVAPAICYDLRFPELFRLGLAQGAEVFALGACWPRTRQHHWRALLLARAIENQAWVLGVNRVGNDPDSTAGPGLIYSGGSIVVSPMGEIAGELSADIPREAVLSIPIDPEAVRAWRAKFPAWKDIRISVSMC
jgi:predicted amidohydrolase